MRTIDPIKIGQRVKTVRTEHSLNQIAFGERLKMNQSAVSAIEKGERIPTTEQLLLAINEFGRTADWWLFGESDEFVVREANPVYTVSMPVRAVAGAGDPCDLDQLEPIGHITIGSEYNGVNITALLIRGSSMEPNIMNGAHVGIDRTDKEVISGQLYAVYIPHEGIVVKRIFIGPELVKIKSDNPTFPDHDLSIDRINWDTFVQGRVKWVLQKY